MEMTTMEMTTMEMTTMEMTLMEMMTETLVSGLPPGRGATFSSPATG